MRKLLLRLTSLVLCLMMVTPAMAAGTAYDSDHLLLQYRDSGTCRTLTGNIRLMCVFVNLPDAAWDNASMQAHKDALSVAVNRLMKEADAYGVPLGFTVKYFTGSASESTSISDDSSAWAENVIANTPGMEPITYGSGTESYYQGMPILFFLPTDGRSFAHSRTSNTAGEYLVLFDEDEPSVIRHELLHLFGARDFYIMDELYNIAKTYIPSSIMLSSSKDENSVDSLTAYTIGWCSTPDNVANGLLQATAHITQEDINQAHEVERITGYGVTERSDYTYAGLMTDGSRNGYGKITWADGSYYEGNWVWGERTGKGTYVWADGDTYTGDFIEGSRTGKGIYTWDDGTVYAGDFVDEVRTGKGTIAWPSGNSYSGDFVDGDRSGKGTFVWASGNTYSGDFANNQFHGKGTYTWTSGDTYVGDFVDGERTGKGTYTWANGDVYTGDFVDGVRTGKGTFTWTNGDIYIGDFVDGVRTGKGTYIWASGDVFTGDFVDNVRSGAGMYVWSDGDVKIGYWQDGQYVGK